MQWRPETLVIQVIETVEDQFKQAYFGRSIEHRSRVPQVRGATPIDLREPGNAANAEVDTGAPANAG